MIDLTDEQRRALRLLARHLEGCAKEVLLAEGFSVGQLAELAFKGLAETKRPRRQSPQGLDADHRGGAEGNR